MSCAQSVVLTGPEPWVEIIFEQETRYEFNNEPQTRNEIFTNKLSLYTQYTYFSCQ